MTIKSRTLILYERACFRASRYGDELFRLDRIYDDNRWEEVRESLDIERENRRYYERQCLLEGIGKKQLRESMRAWGTATRVKNKEQ